MSLSFSEFIGTLCEEAISTKSICQIVLNVPEFEKSKKNEVVKQEKCKEVPKSTQKYEEVHFIVDVCKQNKRKTFFLIDIL